MKLVLGCCIFAKDVFEQFNILWLNPKNPESFPEGLVEALDDNNITVASADTVLDSRSAQSRLRSQMEADSLRPLKFGLDDDEDTTDESPNLKELFSPETIEEATQFLRLTVSKSFDLYSIIIIYLPIGSR